MTKGRPRTVYFDMKTYLLVETTALENKRTFSSMVNILCGNAIRYANQNVELDTSIHYLEKRVAQLERELRAPLIDIQEENK